MEISILGFGTMGQMLAEILINNKSNEITLSIANRTPVKMNDFISTHKNVKGYSDFGQCVKNADLIFLCVRPQAACEVLLNISDKIKPGTYLISIAADLPVTLIEKKFSGKISRIMPTVTSKIKRGITLLVNNSLVNDSDIELIASLFKDSIEFREITDDEMNLFTGITSCGPGLISAILSEYAKSFSITESYNAQLIRDMLIETVIGTCLLSKQQSKSFDQIIDEVATPGGITGAGAAVLRKELPIVFKNMNEEMIKKHVSRSKEVAESF
ncbi:MAG: NAD(P)-binding domain-containing protein [Spirochaetes bacterium]|nr:NAD(P)-binding domain-containing protein [Spirochaetota bacterium]